MALRLQQVRETAAPERAHRRLPARTRFGQQLDRFFEVVAQQRVVAVERRDREAPPLTVGNGTPGRAIGGLHDRPVLVDVAAGTHAARTADEGVALRSAALQW